MDVFKEVGNAGWFLNVNKYDPRGSLKTNTKTQTTTKTINVMRLTCSGLWLAEAVT